jgi:hypothetical protein
MLVTALSPVDRISRRRPHCRGRGRHRIDLAAGSASLGQDQRRAVRQDHRADAHDRATDWRARSTVSGNGRRRRLQPAGRRSAPGLESRVHGTELAGEHGRCGDLRGTALELIRSMAGQAVPRVPNAGVPGSAIERVRGVGVVVHAEIGLRRAAAILDQVAGVARQNREHAFEMGELPVEDRLLGDGRVVAVRGIVPLSPGSDEAGIQRDGQVAMAQQDRRQRIDVGRNDIAGPRAAFAGRSGCRRPGLEPWEDAVGAAGLRPSLTHATADASTCQNVVHRLSRRLNGITPYLAL